MLKNNKGFSTIELMLAILIAGVVMGAVGSFLTFNLRGFNTAKDLIDIQYEGQVTINQLTDIARESTGIASILIDDPASPGNTIDITADIGYAGVEVEPIEIQFNKFWRDGGVIKQYEYTLTYDTTDSDHKHIDCKIRYDDGTSGLQDYSQYVLGFHVESFVIESKSTSFGDSKNMIVKMTFAEGKASYDFQTEINFRNKH